MLTLSQKFSLCCPFHFQPRKLRTESTQALAKFNLGVRRFVILLIHIQFNFGKTRVNFFPLPAAIDGSEDSGGRETCAGGSGGHGRSLGPGRSRLRRQPRSEHLRQAGGQGDQERIR
jgi:hypothetical protein